MIAKLSGRLDEVGADWAVIDVQGVGYLVHCSARTLSALGEVGEACTVHTELQVSENDMRLLGFADSAERRSEEHTSELQSLMRISYAVFCLNKKHETYNQNTPSPTYPTQTTHVS